MFSEELVEINGDCFIIDMMYACKENMTQTPVYEKIGFGNKAYVLPQLWEKLQKLIPILQQRRQKLKIRDAYRPPLAHELLHEIIPQPGFFAATAARSCHCHATAIDCCLCDENGQELRYPTKVDAYTPEFAQQIHNGETEAFFEHLQKATMHYQDPNMTEEIRNREDLKQLMEQIGLESIPHEWWHFNLPNGKETPLVHWQKD